MIKKIFELFVKAEKPLLGRWNLKSCNEISTPIKELRRIESYELRAQSRAS